MGGFAFGGIALFRNPLSCNRVILRRGPVALEAIGSPPDLDQA
jgi:hypothetical protein